ncbi:Na+/K+ ATPase alpha subunit-like protein, partial [Leptotrombidium deliense]
MVKDTGSYRLAVSPDVPDDGRTPEGRPRALRYKKPEKFIATMDELKAEVPIEEHRIPLDQLFGQLQSDPDLGLTPEQVREILLRDGPNTLTPPKVTPQWLKFSENLFGGFALLLWIGGILCFLAYGIQVSQSKNAPDDYLYLGLVLVTV